MGQLVGLCFGTGLVLVLASYALPRAPRRREARALRVLLDAAGLPAIGVGSLVTLCGTCALASTLVVVVVSHTVPVGLVFGCLGGYLPIAVVRARARRRRGELIEVWPDAVDNLTSAVRAGLALPEAVGALAVRGPPALRASFAAFALDYQVSGQFAQSLDRLKERLADPVGDQVVEALRVAREVGGGDLGRLLRRLSSFLRDDARTRAELEARQSWAVNGARLAVAAPWLVLLALCFQRSVIQRYATPLGTLVLVAGCALCVVAYRLMVVLGRLPHERRVLR